MVELKVERNIMFEMATLRKSKSGLPVNVYLDDSGSYKNGGHGPRIELQANTGDSPNTRSMIPMTISDDPSIPVKNYIQQLDGVSESDITKVKSFVLANKDNLLRLCDSDDEYDFSDFMTDMRKPSASSIVLARDNDSIF